MADCVRRRNSTFQRRHWKPNLTLKLFERAPGCDRDYNAKVVKLANCCFTRSRLHSSQQLSSHCLDREPETSCSRLSERSQLLCQCVPDCRVRLGPKMRLGADIPLSTTKKRPSRALEHLADFPLSARWLLTVGPSLSSIHISSPHRHLQRLPLLCALSLSSLSCRPCLLIVR